MCPNFESTMNTEPPVNRDVGESLVQRLQGVDPTGREAVFSSWHTPTHI